MIALVLMAKDAVASSGATDAPYPGVEAVIDRYRRFACSHGALNHDRLGRALDVTLTGSIQRLGPESTVTTQWSSQRMDRAMAKTHRCDQGH